jgi:hypothetical protein
MKTRNFLATVFAICISLAFSFAQRDHKGGSMEDKINHRLDKMDEVVKFTGNQRNEMKTLLTNLANKRKDVICANELGSEGMKNGMKSFRKEAKEEIKKILTPDQMKLMKDFKKEHQGEHKGKGHHGKKGKGTVEDRINHQLDEMDGVVKFTGTQRDQIKTLLTDFAKKKKDAFCANELGSDNMKDAMKGLRENKKEEMKKILTEDQLKLWKDYRKSKKDERKKDTDKNDLNRDNKEK